MTCSRIRPARVDEADELTQIAVRATMRSGYDDAAVARFMPGLKVNPALIAAGLVFVAEDEQGSQRGYTALRPTGMGGLILLEGIYVDPTCARSGFGTRLFETAVQLSRKMAGSVILIYSSPRAVEFYDRLGAIKIGMTPFVFSPEIQLSMFAFTIPAS
ncbi:MULTISPECIES: GNAT family N-acetyltransferase [Bradyrhizobium]|jgi:GNAT superfamily N-acetyltransferase|uniref:GNAT family N-acetyltransferase n=1 Tax=Bradyrhizobium TaxID=374 RepID=UPI000489D01A|nr:MULTISPECIES: GNAT family N-acetyltransferase [Bradyrhizobium]MCS3447474.1 GNAT superfamily N-acetyltransferase [Bradyrhizobium elkanii]MCS3561387.1 GNAT superfamily N-acetyltransferase [Bradyrhizobium elkanii]MCW2148770.1 GNAT superfamily N-acetyltransferase [Bradyrhizobium elkanii]MCW2352142.1 GNAT superfamily N-acetyltransferase [Bradyrhizobium elkanii]MCW2372499.1 GNAT superfamily N-acetyltransferase [Bradyrhizobium elkanii]